jgi:hypothetical protein
VLPIDCNKKNENCRERCIAEPQTLLHDAQHLIEFPLAIINEKGYVEGYDQNAADEIIDGEAGGRLRINLISIRDRKFYLTLV